jgi:ABC-type amino acid transport substrate-binding protein
MRSRLALPVLLAAAVFLAGACGSSSSNQAGAPSLWDQVKKNGDLRVCFADAAPYQTKNAGTGQWEGAFVDYLKGFADVLGVKMTSVDTQFSTMIAAVQSHTCDIGSGLNETNARSLATVFTIPNADTHIDFAIYPDKVPARTWDQLNVATNTVCVMQGSAQDSAFTALNPKTQILRLPDENSCRLAVTSGKAHAFADDWPGNGAVAAANPTVKLIIPNPPIMKQAGGSVIPLGYRYEDLMALNVYTQNWIDSGQRDADFAKWKMGNEQNYAVGP